MQVKIEPSWKEQLEEEFTKGYFKTLVDFIKTEYQTQTIYPTSKLIFNAFDYCPFDDVKVVIIGQDPYHGAGQAHGLCFSVNDGVKIPPSLVNIFKEIRNDMGVDPPVSGNLERWAEQGILLLNATLTVRAGQAASHQGQGWEQFTDAVIQKISDEKEGIVFILWGAFAQKKAAMVNSKKHFILKSAHPSPFSATKFYGNNHFSKTNTILEKAGKAKVQW